MGLIMETPVVDFRDFSDLGAFRVSFFTELS